MKLLKDNMNLLKTVVTLIIVGLLCYDYKSHAYTYDVGLNPIIFAVIGLIFVLYEKKDHMIGFLVSSFTIITAFRISSLAEMHGAKIPFLIIFVLIVLDFVFLAKAKAKSKDGNVQYNWHVTFIRLYFGLDLIPHFAEKLFAGSHHRGITVGAFENLGVADPMMMVIMAGLIEFAACIGITMGLFTRLASVCFAVFLIVATEMGHHFALGFIWAGKGGGWEYPVLWATVVLSFAFVKPTTFSLDHYLTTKGPKLPKLIKKVIG